MKTRAELAKELEDKARRESFAEEKTELQQIFGAFLADLRQFEARKEVVYRMDDVTALKSLKNSIDNLNIPEEIKVVQTTNVLHSTDKVSHNFLWWYFAISSIIVALSLGFAYYTHSNITEQVEIARKEAKTTGYHKGRIDVYNHLPKESQKYLREKYKQWQWEQD